MYLASLVVIVSVSLMVLLWAGFLVWAFHTGQLKDVHIQELRRRPLEDHMPTEQKHHER